MAKSSELEWEARQRLLNSLVETINQPKQVSLVGFQLATV